MKPNVKRRGACGVWVLVAACSAALVVAAGCRSNKVPQPPRPWPEVNACVPDQLPLVFDQEGEGDTRVLARCRSCDNFWRKTRGDWEYTWMVARFDVLDVERGAWAASTLSFICWDSWPTPESGIMLGKPVWPYRRDNRLAFELDTSGQPARIVGQTLVYDPYMAPATQPAGD